MKDRTLRTLGIALAVTIAGWSLTSVGCLCDNLWQPTAEVLKLGTIEDPDWDADR